MYMYDMSIRGQLWRASLQLERGLRFIDELNAVIELKVYANGNEEKAIAMQMMKDHLASFDVASMTVSKANFAYIRRLQKEYGIEK